MLVCDLCGSGSRVHKLGRTGMYLCRACYSREYQQPRVVCSRCRQLKPVTKRTDQGPVCPACYSREYRRVKKANQVPA